MSTTQWKREHQEEMRAYQREYYEKNKAQRIAEVRAREQELAEWLAEYKSHLSCERCGEDHLACLVFHHRNPTEKEAPIAQVVHAKGWGKERILEEIAKCDVLYANCHRKLHWVQRQG